jgi:hypothetical protein
MLDSQRCTGTGTFLLVSYIVQCHLGVKTFEKEEEKRKKE